MENLNLRKVKTMDSVITEENWLNYAIEALQETSETATNLFKFTAQEILGELKHELILKGIYIEYHIIGGVACNTHINHNETIDILILVNESTGEESYKNPSNEDLILIRDFSKRFLQNKFPKALIDDSQPLAINQSIPSKPCNFCYYFGFWQTKTAAFGNFPPPNSVQLLNGHTCKLIESDPFTFVSEIDKKDNLNNGNVKNLIRILKNLKADAEESISLTGYQISSIIYNMEEYSLAKSPGQLLFLLLEVSLYLKRIIDSPYLSNSLRTPENIPLLDKDNHDSFHHGVKALKKVTDELIKKLIMQVDLYQDIYEEATVINP